MSDTAAGPLEPRATVGGKDRHVRPDVGLRRGRRGDGPPHGMRLARASSSALTVVQRRASSKTDKRLQEMAESLVFVTVFV